MWNFILIAVLAIILGFSINYLLGKFPKFKLILQIVLPILIILLGYRLYYGIEIPIDFEKQKDVRYKVVVEKLKQIRESQAAFKTVHGQYANDFDTLINFLKNDSLPMIRAIGSLSDSLIEAGMSEAEGVANGYIIRDTIKVSVRDSLFGVHYPIDSLRYIPYTENVEFEMAAGEVVTGSKVKVKVFEAKAPYEVWLKGLDEQLVINLIEHHQTNDLYEGLMVGDVNEANNNAGNWE
jgi:hypothetical protein